MCLVYISISVLLNSSYNKWLFQQTLNIMQQYFNVSVPESDGVETVPCVACDPFKDIFGVHSTHISFTFIGR